VAQAARLRLRGPGRGWLPVVAAAVVVAVALGAYWMSRSDAEAPAAGSAFPPPVRVGTTEFRLEQLGADPVTAWRLPEPLLGPRDVLVAADGTVWLTEQNRGAVDTFVDGTLTRHDTTGFEYAGAFALAEGPGGSVWFSGYPGGAIGRVLADGRANVFAPLLPAAATIGIVQAADGVMWVADRQNGVLISVSPRGSVATWPIPVEGGSSQPRDLALGADGAVWFTDAGTDAIGRAVTHGDAEPTFEEYPLGRGVEPRSIAAAPDGTVWVTLPEQRALAMLPVAGGTPTIVEVEGLDAPPNDLVLAEDGSIWITEQGSDVLHVRPDGSLIERVRLPGGATYADGLAIDPNGDVWTVASDSDLLVRISAGD
jgi:virginiamycin B lyase